jgi:hypothetical protein
MDSTKAAYGEEGLSLSKARLEPRLHGPSRRHFDKNSMAPQDERC